MSDRFAGRTALVTGAASGIGAATTRLLVSQGANVVAVDRDEGGLAALYSATESVTRLPMDLSQPLPDDLVERAGDIDILVNAAGILRRSTTLEHSLEDWNDTLAVNLTAPHELCQQFVRALLNRGAPGAIVNVCSIESFTAARDHIAYTVSKSALLMLTRSFALELAPRGIRVNAIAPGVTETGMNVDLRSDAVRSARLKAPIPMARFGLPEEQAAVIAFLASDDASYVTGAIVPVDGGFLTR
jgi:NAD(P)-dependent dehydrogenase (short-subunit alcohol dehydrogenase family)